jgi:hypothetical protein
VEELILDVLTDVHGVSAGGGHNGIERIAATVSL